MSGTEFVHLHVHSQYSLLDGAIKVKDLVARTKAFGMRAVALTDHGNMFGAIQLYKQCKDAGLQAILGCEVNVARGWGPPPPPRREKKDGKRGKGDGADQKPGPPDLPVDHLVLLAASEEGYKNLIRIVSRGHVDPASALAPSVPFSAIEGHGKGLIALTGCMGGVLAQRILEEGEAACGPELERLRAAFDPGALYVELQDHGLPEQAVVNGILAGAAEAMDLPLVATNDAHFGAREDGQSQLFLSCIARNRAFVDAEADHHGSFEMFLKPPEEMAYAFRARPEAVRSTLEVAEKCAGLKLKLGKPMLPTFRVPDGMDAADYFRKVARDGLDRRFAEARERGRAVDEPAYRARLEAELNVIVRMDFPGYFLIVWDFIRFAKENGVPVGPGRGSGAGSLVAYAMRITDLDPIPYNLLFERFLNPERVSMPDFDVDFCMDKRDRVIAYVAERYGKDSVGQIATFHELKAKSVIKDVARAMGFSPVEAQRVANLIPDKGQGQTYTIPEAVDVEPKLKALAAADAAVAELLAQAQKIEGLTRHAGMHAAGVVISEGPLWDHVPCFRNGEQIVTQFYMGDVEQAGLVKFDFLGLKTLTVIDVAVKLVDERPDVASGVRDVHGAAGADGRRRFDVSAIPMDDHATFELLQSGETTGVFQLESTGMQKLFVDLRPDAFEDIVAAVALYRPGPLGTGMVKDFVDCKHGRKPIESMHPLVDEVLAPTYGVIVYQEQVMQVAQRLAGYSLGSADLLRRAMGKKKPEEMAKQKATFVSGSEANGVRTAEAERIFGLLEYFAGYGFNKSHSAAYALLTYQTAYLKAHYPVEFLCALMTADKQKIEKVVRIIAESRAMGVEVLPPEINESKTDFTVVYEEDAAGGGAGDGAGAPSEAAKASNGKAGGKAGGKASGKASGKTRIADPLRPKIRFGLGAIRGVGDSAIEAILKARAAGGPFADMFDFAQRVDPKRVNKGVLESLVQSGAFDASLQSRGIPRARAFAAVDRALDRSRRASRDRARGQGDLFAAAAPGAEAKVEARTEAKGEGGEAWAETWSDVELDAAPETLGFRWTPPPARRFLGLASWARARVQGNAAAHRLDVAAASAAAASAAAASAAYAAPAASPWVMPRAGGVDEHRRRVLRGDGTPIVVRLVEDDAPPAAAVRARGLRAGREHVERLRDILRRSPGRSPVQLIIELDDGVEAVLALDRSILVEPSEAFFAEIEKFLRA